MLERYLSNWTRLRDAMRMTFSRMTRDAEMAKSLSDDIGKLAERMLSIALMRGVGKPYSRLLFEQRCCSRQTPSRRTFSLMHWIQTELSLGISSFK